MSKLAEHAKALQSIDGKSVDAGWFENAKYTTGESVAAVMIVNEFGKVKPVTPARPLLRQSAEKIDQKLPGWVARRTTEMLEGKLEPEAYLKRMGEVVVATIQETLNEGKFAPNSDVTVNGSKPDKNGKKFIKGKGFNKPLVGETGLLGQSIQAKVS